MMLEDIQNQPDDRQFAINAVGISGIRYPIAVSDRRQGKQHTVADISMAVSLRADIRGAHLSRFIEIIHETAGSITLFGIADILSTIRQRLDANLATLEFRYPYFVARPAPVTGSLALMEYECCLSGESSDDKTRLFLATRVPVTSVCPCSKAISDYGAHNQRSHITIKASPRHSEDAGPTTLWVEDLIDIAESAASCPVFPLLKRPDERYVTMRAYDNPAFVEDIVRSAAQELSCNQHISWYRVHAISDESIHNHQAFAQIESAPHQSQSSDN